MPGYAPNISWLSPDMVVARRPGEIEFGFPSDVDLKAIDACRQDQGLQVTLFNQDGAVRNAANRRYLAGPSRRDEFWRKFDEALETAGTKCVCQRDWMPA
jgi:hydroxypyruvate isomerase